MDHFVDEVHGAIHQQQVDAAGMVGTKRVELPETGNQAIGVEYAGSLAGAAEVLSIVTFCYVECG
jgi:hypothetical protein